jgi:hypothetical protein
MDRVAAVIAGAVAFGGDRYRDHQEQQSANPEPPGSVNWRWYLVRVDDVKMLG